MILHKRVRIETDNILQKRFGVFQIFFFIIELKRKKTTEIRFDDDVIATSDDNNTFV